MGGEVRLPPTTGDDAGDYAAQFHRYGALAQYYDASQDILTKYPVDSFDLNATAQTAGDVDAYLQIPGGSTRDPYETMDEYNSRWSAPNGQPAVRSDRWKNDAHDAATIALATTSPTDPKLVTVFHSVMEIMLRELPMIPLL